MKKKCEKCKASEHLDRMGNPIWAESTAFKCDSYFFHGEKLIQSDLCRERCKVAKLKKKLAETEELFHKAVQMSVKLKKENETLRNPNF